MCGALSCGEPVVALRSTAFAVTEMVDPMALGLDWPPHVSGALLSLEGLAVIGSPGSLAEKWGLELPPSLCAAVDTRQYEYLAGRACASNALCAAGYSGNWVAAIGEGGAPTWPEGFVGSIAHGGGVACAVAAQCEAVRALGVDVEQRLDILRATEVRDQVLGPGDLDDNCVPELAPADYVTAVFAAKEALYKCLWPRLRTRMDFHDVRCVEVCARQNKLTLRLARALAPVLDASPDLEVMLQWDSRRVLAIAQLVA
jgi:enterobactin synthetase component D